METSTQIQVHDHFAAFESQANQWMEKAQLIKVTNASQTDLMEGAREARLALRGIRISVDKKHKELKEDALRYGQALDKARRMLVGKIEPIEAVLQEQEDFKKVQEEKAKKELFSRRATKLTEFMTMEEAAKFPLGDMGEEAFENLLFGFKSARERKLKEEEDQRLENERKEKDGEAERKRLAEDNEKLRLENQKKEKKLQDERAEKKQLEDEAESKRQQEEQKKKDEANAKRKAARQPDKEKIKVWAKEIAFISPPKVKDEEAEKIIRNAIGLLAKVVTYLNDNAERL